jgi:hypothetical protein
VAAAKVLDAAAFGVQRGQQAQRLRSHRFLHEAVLPQLCQAQRGVQPVGQRLDAPDPPGASHGCGDPRFADLGRRSGCRGDL